MKEISNDEWVDKYEAIIQEGVNITGNASNAGLEYVMDVVQNLDDPQWRQMAIEQQALEIGIGKGLDVITINRVVKDFKKNLHKKLKLPREAAAPLIEIYLGVVVKDIVRQLNERNK